MSDKPTRCYFLHALTSLHVGAGRGLGYIDLPVVREKVTNWPYVPASSVKGVLADHYNADTAGRNNDPKLAVAFGRAGSDNNDNSGSLVFTDARLVCMPVRSLYGTFAWVTSPLALLRLQRDLDMAGFSNIPKSSFNLGDEEILTPQGTGSALNAPDGKAVFLEDLDLIAKGCGEAAAWSNWLVPRLFPDEKSQWRIEFKKRFAVVSDTVFNFLAETATEVIARIRIQTESKTVVEGALWNEEALPAETILSGFVWCDRVFGNKEITRSSLLETFCKDFESLQFGGKATTGKGRVRCIFNSNQTGS